MAKITLLSGASIRKPPARKTPTVAVAALTGSVEKATNAMTAAAPIIASSRTYRGVMLERVTARYGPMSKRRRSRARRRSIARRRAP